MNKKRVIIILVLVLVVVAGGLAIYFCSDNAKEVDNAEGSMSIICPIQVYNTGDQIKSPCPLKPGMDCSYLDQHNCENVMKNVGTQDIEKGMHVEVVRTKVDGVVQFIDVRIPYQ